MILTTVTLLGFGIALANAEPHPHVYLFRGLADVFSTGMDTLQLRKPSLHRPAPKRRNRENVRKALMVKMPSRVPTLTLVE
jgi:hypothetical protein